MLQTAFRAKADGTDVAASVAPDTPVEMGEPVLQAVRAGQGMNFSNPAALFDPLDRKAIVEPVRKRLGAFAMSGKLRAASLPEGDNPVGPELILLEKLDQATFLAACEEPSGAGPQSDR